MLTLDRRALVAAALSVAALPRFARAATPASGSLHFNILRGGKPFGRYQVAFVTTGDQLAVTTDVAMNARIAGLTVFDYKHHCEEIWRGGRFMELHSQSVRDNQDSQSDVVSAVRSAAGISVTNKSGVVSLPSSACPLTHWNSAAFAGPLFNPQDGYLLLNLTAVQAGHDTAVLANGASLPATHWALRGSQTLDEWYDDSGVWAGLRAVFPDKSIIEYRRT